VEHFNLSFSTLVPTVIEMGLETRDASEPLRPGSAAWAG